MRYNIYLEPYIYFRFDKKRALLVNFLNDEFLLSGDNHLFDIIQKIVSSPNNMFVIDKKQINDYIPILQVLRKNNMGNYCQYEQSSMQFISEINIVEGKEAQEKVSLYSRLNQGLYFSEMTLICNQEKKNCSGYLKYMYGNDNDASIICNKYCVNDYDEKKILSYIKDATKYNNLKRIRIVGLNVDGVLGLVNSSVVKEFCHKGKLHFCFNYSWILENDNLEIENLISDSNFEFDIIVDKNIEELKDWQVYNKKHHFLYPIDNSKQLLSYNSYIEKSPNYDITPYLVLNPVNMESLHKYILFSADDLLNQKHKYRIIRTNNCLNSTYWGRIIIFGGEYVSYGSNKVEKLNNYSLEEHIKESFSNLSSDWFAIRNYDSCKRCIFQYLCPSPSPIEDYLRKYTKFKCLLFDKNRD